MSIRVDCECGKPIIVDEGAAGTLQTCSCGRSVEIPSIRRGLRAYSTENDSTEEDPAPMEFSEAGVNQPLGMLCGDCERYDAHTKGYTVLHIVFVFFFVYWRTDHMYKCRRCMRSYLFARLPLALIMANFLSPIVVVWWFVLLLRTFF